MALDGTADIVKAVYSFKGQNNDELNFRKGDVITVTQKVDGGWWEGTLNGMTGWFPSNYVKECKIDPGNSVVKTAVQVGSRIANDVHCKQETMRIYRNMVLKDIIDSERTFIDEMLSLQKLYLSPLQASNILTMDEFHILVGNLDELIEVHQKLLTDLEDCNDIPARMQRIGGIFMILAQAIKAIHLTYCSNHPLAVTVLEKHRDSLNKFMESYGGFRVLTTGLSRPFRRFEKYQGLLLEVQRHIEESHVDRGDTQRAVHVYKDISEECSNMRRRKEMELEVLRGNIMDWEGESIHQLGDVLLMSQVSVVSDLHEKRERHLALFRSTLVFLSVGPMSTFVYEGKLPLTGIEVSYLEDVDDRKNAFQILGKMIDTIAVVCHSADERNVWLDMLKQQISLNWSSVANSTTKSHAGIAHNVYNSPVHSSLDTKPQSVKSPYKPPNRVWTRSCLRPSPALKPCVVSGPAKDSRTFKNKEEHSYEDDVRLLRVIEAYCTSAKTRNTVNSAFLVNPQVLIAEEEKIINEVTTGNQTIIEEKSLVDTIYALKDQIKDLQQESRALSRALEEERQARRKLEDIVRKHLLPGCNDIKWDE